MHRRSGARGTLFRQLSLSIQVGGADGSPNRIDRFNLVLVPRVDLGGYLPVPLDVFNGNIEHTGLFER